MSGRKAALIDRDGTLIENRHYLADPDGVAFIPGAIDALGLLRDAGYKLIIVTNQSGIARGYFDRATLDAIHDRMTAMLMDAGIMLDGIYVCPHGPDDGCDCRKPRPGLARQAARDHGLDLTHSVVIGDNRSDTDFGLAIGARPILVGTGHGAAFAAAGLDPRVDVVTDLCAAARLTIAPDVR